MIGTARLNGLDPVFYLRMVLQGQGLGDLLLTDALYKAWQASKLVSCRAVVVDAKEGCVFRSMWAGDSIRCGHLFRSDVGSICCFTVIGAHIEWNGSPE